MIFEMGSVQPCTQALCVVPRRVLTIHVGPRYAGLVLLEEYGLMHRGFRTITLRGRGSDKKKGQYLAKRINQALHRYRPDIVSISRSRHPLARSCRNIHEEILKFLENRHVPYECHTSREIRLFMLGRERQKKRDQLAKVLSERFVPPLADQISLIGERERYRRTAWLALGLAVFVLASRFPLSIVTLTHGDVELVHGLKKFLCDRVQKLNDGELH